MQPMRFPSVLADRILLCILNIVESPIRFEADFDRPLDPDRLAKALELTIYAEPILGCRIVEDERKPYWESQEFAANELLTEASNESEYIAFRRRPMDYNRAPHISACLLKGGGAGGGDKLLIKVNHIAADAGGTKETAELTASIYTRLGREPNYRPEPNAINDRSLNQVFRNVPLFAYPKIYLNFIKAAFSKTFPTVSKSIRIPERESEEPEQLVRVFDAAQISRIKRAIGAPANATINDVFIAAHLKAIEALSPDEEGAALRIATTVDFRRRYIKGNRGQAPANLSAFEFYNLGKKLEPNFMDLAKRVASLSRRRKMSWLGLSDIFGALPIISLLKYSSFKNLFLEITKRDIARRNFPLVFTNMGPITKEGATFDFPAVSALLHAPAPFLKSVATGLTGYEGGVYLTMGTYSGEKGKRMAKQFLDKIYSEIEAAL